MRRGGLSVAEFLPHNSAINSRFQSEFWPIFENHAIKGPAHLGILRVRGGNFFSTCFLASLGSSRLVIVSLSRNML